jgi:hypothetical protein
MKKLFAALLGIAVLSTATLSLTTPASALGGCGPNGHRNAAGFCVFGGQNEDWCIRKTGHPATRMPNGTLRCL